MAAGDITFSSEQDIANEAIGNISIVRLDTDIYAASWYVSGTGIRAVIITISGTTISMGTVVTVEASGASDPVIAKLGSGKFIVA